VHLNIVELGHRHSPRVRVYTRETFRLSPVS
jgi:hypothetical protein